MELTQGLRRISILTAFSTVAIGIAMPQPTWSDTGTEGAAFLEIPVGARPAALGSAYTALATDAYAPIWNPGGLGLLKKTELAGQHLSYLESIHYEFLSFALPVSAGKAIGFSAQYLGTGDIGATDEQNRDIGTYSSYWGAYTAAYGQRLSEKLSAGLSAKWINAKISDVSANAFAADAGLMYRASDALRLAAAITNMGSSLKFSQEGDPLPLEGHLGLAYGRKHWNAALEGVYSRSGLLSGRLGLEWIPIQMIALRTGYRTETTDGLGALAGFTVGMGLNMWGQELSYAWLPYGDLGSTQYVSLNLRFGAEKEERQNLIQYQDIKKHRTTKGMTPTDPEFQQLLQLLSEDDPRLAERADAAPAN